MVNITQLHRIIVRSRKSADADWDTLTIDADDLGEGSYMSFNIAPMKRSRSSAKGTTEQPVQGTFESFSGTLNILLDNWKIVGTLLNNFKKATYTGADEDAGQITDAESNICAADKYFSIIAQGLCDDGSSADIELTRCMPSLENDIEPGTSETPTVEIALNPMIYNASRHANDGYPQCSYRLGDQSTTQKMRLNVTTGEYEAVTE